jgi:hypothetical protein
LSPVRTVAKRVLERHSDAIFRLYERSMLARRAMRFAEGFLRRAPTPDEFRLYGREVHFPAEKAEKHLRYRAAVQMREGVELSAGWLRHHGYLGLGG